MKLSLVYPTNRFPPKKGDSGYLAEELLNGKSSDLNRRCKAILKTVEDKDFTFEEALRVYEVSAEEFYACLIEQLMGELKSYSRLFSTEITALFTIQLMESAYEIFLKTFDSNPKKMENQLRALSKQVEEHTH